MPRFAAATARNARFSARWRSPCGAGWRGRRNCSHEGGIFVAGAALRRRSRAGARTYLDCHFAPGWQQTGAIGSTRADNLYDYKDGAAEGYLSFGFVRMQGIDCKAGADTLAIDVSEMDDADAAYGIFTANRDPRLPVAAIGMGGQIQAQSASLPRANTTLKSPNGGGPQGRPSATLQAFAMRVVALLEGRNTHPEDIAVVPQTGSQVSARLVPESVLGLRLLKRGYVAKYKQGQAFIVLEATPESAAAVLKKLRERFDGAAEPKSATRHSRPRPNILADSASCARDAIWRGMPICPMRRRPPPWPFSSPRGFHESPPPRRAFLARMNPVYG